MAGNKYHRREHNQPYMALFNNNVAQVYSF